MDVEKFWNIVDNSRKIVLESDKDRIRVGMVFDTPFEDGCVVSAGMDTLGIFLAIDSDGVECEYIPEMITKTYESGE